MLEVYKFNRIPEYDHQLFIPRYQLLQTVERPAETETAGLLQAQTPNRSYLSKRETAQFFFSAPEP